MLQSKELTQAIDFCDTYRQSPDKMIRDYQIEHSIPLAPVLRAQEELDVMEGNLSLPLRQAIDSLINEMNEKNLSIVNQSNDSYKAKELLFKWQPLLSIGVYIPYKFTSSLVTWLSAAYAAKVPQLTVYLAQNPKTGEACPACVYAARKYKALTLVGPARFAFPCLAFGDGIRFKGTDLLCGPAGQKLNVLKQVAALLALKKTDFFAGPSELAIVLEDTKYLPQAKRDLLAQLEHGPDSKAQLIHVGNQNFEETKALESEKILYHRIETWDQAVSLLKTLAVETVELLGKKEIVEPIVTKLNYCGVAYSNISSSLGDYCVVGRGCGDPTQGTARHSSGVSPWLFMRMQACIFGSLARNTLSPQGIYLSEYEGLLAHRKAIQEFEF